MRSCLLIVLLFGACMYGYTQDVENSLLENLTAILSENTEDELNTEELIETWEYFLKNKININAECTEQLRQLRFLSEFQIREIIDFKKQNGPLLSIYELATIDGLSRDYLQSMEPFLLFGKTDAVPVFRKYARRELFFRTQRNVETAKGYSGDGAYVGSPEKYYIRFKQTGDRLNFGFTAEKDPGEALFREPNAIGFDYYSAFVNYSIDKGRFKFYGGDFSVKAGQGLVFGQGFVSGKSAEVSGVYQSIQGIRSYSSVDENRFFRGVAGELNCRNVSLCLFHSEKKIDANMDELDGEKVFTSFQSSGMHRTLSEIADKHAVNENVTGILFTFQKNNFSLGFSGVHTVFDIPKIKDEQAYKLFLFDGRRIFNAGFNYKWSLGKIFLFGETAYSLNGGIANLHSAMLKPADRIELSLLYRNFSKKYNSLYGQAFSESSTVNDEQGFYVGAKFFPVAKVTVSAYRDFFEFRWLKYQTAAPSVGAETFFQLDYLPNMGTKFYLRYFFEQKEVKFVEGQIKFNSVRSIKKARLNFEREIDACWSLRSRAEFSLFNDGAEEKGMLLFQDIKYKSARLPFSFQLRLAWFDTEGYNSRLYAYENDLLYNFSIPALSGKGIRSYLNGKYSFSEKLDFWFKLARTQYFDKEMIGTAWDEIAGDRKTEIKFQMRYRF